MKPSKLDRFPRLITDLRAEGGFAAHLMVANVFLILGIDDVIKPLREGWIAVCDISGLSRSI